MGYIRLSQFMADENYPIFRLFRASAARDLLFLQAELTHLETEYQRVAKADRESDDPVERNLYAYEWWHLSQSSSRGFEGQQWALALQIRKKLKEYYESLHQYTQMATIHRPKESEVTKLRNFIDKPAEHGGYEFIGRDLAGVVQESVYDTKFTNDLAMLANSSGENDAFTKLMLGPILSLFHFFWKYTPCKKPVPPDAENQANEINLYYHYSDERIHTVIGIVGTVASSLTPMISIIALYFVTRMSIRLALVCVFTVLFSLTLALATRARRIEVFAATAAFASVQVVFVGSTSGNVSSTNM